MYVAGGDDDDGVRSTRSASANEFVKSAVRFDSWSVHSDEVTHPLIIAVTHTACTRMHQVHTPMPMPIHAHSHAHVHSCADVVWLSVFFVVFQEDDGVWEMDAKLTGECTSFGS